jgi:hypothetical protein
MNKGVQILLERIKSNPEEFTPDIIGKYPEKWRNILVQIESRASGEVPSYLDFLSDAEIQEVWRALQNVRGDQFTKQVMNTILRDGVELSSSSYQAPSESRKGKFTKVTALDIKVAKEFGMELGEYIANKDKMGITT